MGGGCAGPDNGRNGTTETKEDVNQAPALHAQFTHEAIKNDGDPV